MNEEQHISTVRVEIKIFQSSDIYSKGSIDGGSSTCSPV